MTDTNAVMWGAMSGWLWPVGALIATLGSIAVMATIAAILLLRDHSRLSRHIAGLTRDIERLNDRNWEIADSEDRYRSLIEAQGDLIVQRNKDGQIILANPSYAALLGLAVADIIGTQKSPRRVRSGLIETTLTGTRIFDECLATQDGERWFSWVETPVTTARGESVIQRVGRDVTDRVAVEQALHDARVKAEAASDAKSRFLATVSHEFRTPLNGILGMADLLNDTRVDPEQATYIAALRTSGEALLSLVDDILDFAKVEAGKLELVSEPFDLTLLVESVAELMAPRAQAKGVDLAALVAHDLPERVIGDIERVRQIMLNLVGNAVKFTERGGIGIHVRPTEGGIALIVDDTGPGIDAQRIGAIFDEFEQASATTSQAYGGTGLGLAIVKRLVKLMHGRIDVVSELGQGSSFRVFLPFASSQDAQASGRCPDWSDRNFIVASSSRFGGQVLVSAIETAQANVRIATTIAEAGKALVQQQAWDGILIDHALGDHEARKLAGIARKVGIPRIIIVLSPLERRSFGPTHLAGFTGFLVKPVRPRSLYRCLGDGSWEQDAVSVPVQAPAHQQSKTRRLRVLLAEDNDINALLMTRTLEKMGCEPVWANDGRAALDRAEASLTGQEPEFDLVLLDIRMPGLDGLSTARLIRAAEQTSGRETRLPILAVSANVLEEDRRAALSAGMDDCLGKPLNREALAAWIGRLQAAKAAA